MVEKFENIETKIDDKFISDKNGNNSETKQDNKEENSKSKKIYQLSDKEGALFSCKTNPDDLQETIKCKYLSKKHVSHNTFIFSYELPDKNVPLGLNLGQHIAIDVDLITKDFPEGETVCRKYTPISWIEQKGTVDMLIKVYFKNEFFPDGGKMSQHLHDLEEGKDINIRGPLGKFLYLGNGHCKILTKFKPLTYFEHTYKKMGLIGAGTGIAPLFQILQAADRNHDTIEFTLLFGNSHEKDILLRDELEAFANNKNFKFTLIFMLTKEEKSWKGERGHFNYDNIKKYMPEPSDDTIIVHCGRRSLCNDVIEKCLEKIGHKKENVFQF